MDTKNRILLIYFGPLYTKLNNTTIDLTKTQSFSSSFCLFWGHFSLISSYLCEESVLDYTKKLCFFISSSCILFTRPFDIIHQNARWSLYHILNENPKLQPIVAYGFVYLSDRVLWHKNVFQRANSLLIMWLLYMLFKTYILHGFVITITIVQCAYFLLIYIFWILLYRILICIP